jgi:hypothetical protein
VNGCRARASPDLHCPTSRGVPAFKEFDQLVECWHPTAPRYTMDFAKSGAEFAPHRPCQDGAVPGSPDRWRFICHTSRISSQSKNVGIRGVLTSFADPLKDEDRDDFSPEPKSCHNGWNSGFLMRTWCATKVGDYTGESISSMARAREGESRNVFLKVGFTHDISLHCFLKPVAPSLPSG